MILNHAPKLPKFSPLCLPLASINQKIRILLYTLLSVEATGYSSGFILRVALTIEITSNPVNNT